MTPLAKDAPQEARMGVRVCGVDCHPNDQLCNGYCTGKADRPPAMELPPTVSADDVRAVAAFLDQKLLAAHAGKRGVMLSWEDAQGFVLVLRAAADALPAASPSPEPT